MPDRFHALLSQLAEEHERSLADTVRTVREENNRLRKELDVYRQHVWSGDPTKKADAYLSGGAQSSPPQVAAHGRAAPEIGAHMALTTSTSCELPPLPGAVAEAPGPAINPLKRGHPVIRTTSIGNTVKRAASIGSVGSASQPMRAVKSTATTVATTPNGFSLDRTFAKLDSKHRQKHRVRIQDNLNLRSPSDPKAKECLVDAKHLHETLRKKTRNASFDSYEHVQTLLWELECCQPCPAGAVEPKDLSVLPCDAAAAHFKGMDLNRFVDLLLLPSLPHMVRPSMAEDVALMQDVLLTDDVKDIIDKATRQCATDPSEDCEKGKGGSTPQEQNLPLCMLHVLNVVVSVTVIASLVVLGVSMDIRQGWFGWIAIEGAFCAVFLAEVLFKNWLLTPARYFCGPERIFNWLDAGITFFAVVDLCVSTATYDPGRQDAGVSIGRVSMVLRALRIARIARLVKLLRAPFLRELANMLAGFLIGIPWLLWVMVLLFVIVYILALIFRQMLGPLPGQQLMATCGGGDGLTEVSPPECETHLLYGEEFFGDIQISMFTIFRCMIGDCSTRSGQALSVHFSHGYGLRFDIVYCIGMVFVIFGLFNIVTALFVEATLSGLKTNDVQKKYLRMYERRYVEKKLKTLVGRIYQLTATSQDTKLFHSQADGVPDDFESITLSEEMFVKAMHDPIVNELFDDLDVNKFNRAGLFDMFDLDGNGTVSMSELVDTLIKLRGEPQKSDIIASYMVLRSMRDKLEDFQLVMLENQKRLMTNQKEIWAVLGHRGPRRQRSCSPDAAAEPAVAIS